MKRSELRQIIREEIKRLKESTNSKNLALLDKLADKLSDLELRGKENTPEYKQLNKKYKELESKIKESAMSSKLIEEMMKDAAKTMESKIRLSSFLPEARVYFDDKDTAMWSQRDYAAVGIFNPKTWDPGNEGFLYKTNDVDGIVKLKPGEQVFRYRTTKSMHGARPLIKVDKKRGVVYFLTKDTQSGHSDKIEFEKKGIPVNYMRFLKGSVNEESYKVAGRRVTLVKGKESDGTDWKVKFQNGKEVFLSDVLSLIKPFPKGITK